MASGEMSLSIGAIAKLKSQFAHEWVDRTRGKLRGRKLLSQKDDIKAVAVVKSEKELEKLAYHLQADEAMNTEEAFMQREKLKRHHMITDALALCWRTVMGKVHMVRSDADSLIKGEYVQLHRCLFQNLLPEEDYDPKEAKAEAEADWDEDRGDDDFLEESEFRRSIFELADLYVPTLEPQDYVDFLKNLNDKVSSSGSGRSRRSRRSSGSRGAEAPARSSSTQSIHAWTHARSIARKAYTSGRMHAAAARKACTRGRMHACTHTDTRAGARSTQKPAPLRILQKVCRERL